MSSIKDITGLTSQLKKMERSESNRKLKSSDVQERSTTATQSGQSGDKAEISAIGREMLQIRAESSRYQEVIDKVKTRETDEIAELKSKVANGHYNSAGVISDIVEKLFDLPNF